MLKALIVLALTYVGIIFTKLPRINIDRPAAALTGAVLMVLLGVLTFPQAVAAIDFNTIALLFGMMLMLAALQRAGFITLLAARSVSMARSPWRMMVLVIAATALGSAFLVNDVVVLLFTPVVIQACRMRKMNPVPYLIAEAMASNIGSVATIIGNPQNMLIGVTSGISFMRFFLSLLPVSLVSTAMLIAVVGLFYRKEMAGSFENNGVRPETLTVAAGQELAVEQKRLMVWVLPILGLTLLAFFLSSFIGLNAPLVAMVGGVAAVLFSGLKPSRLVQNVDWSLLVFFIGLFIVVGGAQHAGVLNIFLNRIDIAPDATGIISVHFFSALISQLVSNVPLTMLVIPLLHSVPGHLLWVSLAAGSTLGGNATLIGAVANLIVVERAYRMHVKVGWWEFSRIGLVVTVLSLAASAGILILEFNLGLLR